MLRAMRGRKVFHGWWSVLALSITETVSFGVLYYAFTVFVSPMARELGTSVATVAGAYAIGMVVAGLAAAPVGAWLDRHGARALMTAGSLAAGALLMAWSFVDGVVALYLVWLLMGFVLAAVLYEHRSTALTVLTFIAGFASVIFLPLAGYLVEALGWREALRVLAVIVWLVTVPLHLLVLRRHPRDVGQEVDGGPATARPAAPRARPRLASPSIEPAAAFRSGAFAWLVVSFTASMMVLVALGVHLVPILEARGLAALEAAAVGGAVGLAALPGRLVFTPLGALVSRHAVTAAIFGAQTLGLLALWWVPGSAGLTAFVVLFGLGFGAITPARAALVVETFGPAWYGTISGRMWLIGTAARAVAPVALGWLVDVGFGYGATLAPLAALTAVAAAAVLMAGRCTPRLTAHAEPSVTTR